MKLGHSNQTILLQKQIISTKQIQALEILSLCNVDLDVIMQSEYLQNPLLENKNSEVNVKNSKEYNEWYNHTSVQNEDIFTYFWDQLDLLKYSSEEKKVIDILIGYLDDNGFLVESIDELQRLIKTSKEIIVKCLKDLKGLEPIGVFSSGLSECLVLQLKTLGIEDGTLRTIIEDYLEELSQGKIALITRKLNISSTEVRKYIALISTLNPRPLAGLGIDECSYVIPDIIVTQNENVYEIDINDNWLGNYQISDYYLDMLNKTDDPELIEYFQEKKKRVLFLIEAIEQRRKTLINIVKEFIGCQGGVLKEKSLFKPVTMKQIADRMGVNVSTVSRAVKDKYIQYPKGTIAMKEMFSVSISENEDGGMNAEQIKTIMKEFIVGENKNKPYSDAELVKLLEDKGIKLSRRGVAKYRDALGIKGSFDRKVLK